MNNLEELFTKIRPLILATGEFIRQERVGFSADKIEYKGVADLVSYVDKSAEKKLVAGLSAALPEAGFLTEEKTINKKGERYEWIIDPLDGTTNFIHGLPPYSISVALRDGDEMVLGMVYEITKDELFYAIQGKGAFLNDQPIRVSPASSLENSLLITGFPYDRKGKLEDWLRVFSEFTGKTHGVRRLGSAAIDLCYVACGRVEGFYEYNLNAWDVAAGAFIIQQAGGTVLDFGGEPDFIGSRTLIASNGRVHDEMQQLINAHFPIRSF